MIPRFLSVAQLWLVLPAVVTFVVVATRVEFEPELWSQINRGRMLAAWLLGHEPISPTFLVELPQRFDRAWLAETVLAWVMDFGGPAAVQLVSAGVLTSLIGLLTALTYHRGGEPRVAFLLVAVAWPFVVLNPVVRFDGLGHLLFMLLLVVLWNPTGRVWRAAALCGLVQLVWANSHATFILGVLTPLVFLVGRIIDLAVAGRVGTFATDRLTRTWALCSLATAVATVMHPQPAWLAHDLLASLGAVAGESLLDTHRRGLDGWLLLLFVGSVAATVVVINFASHRLRGGELLLLVSLLLLGSLSPQGSAWYALVLAGGLAPAVRSLWPLRPRGARLPDPAEAAFNVVVLLMLLGLVVVSTPWTKSYNPILPASRLATVAPGEPASAVEALRQRGFQGRVFTTEAWGAYLAWQLAPHVRVPLDAADAWVPASTRYTFRTVAEARLGWAILLDRWQVEAVVWPASDDQLSAALMSSPDWELANVSPTARVFVRTAAASD